MSAADADNEPSSRSGPSLSYEDHVDAVERALRQNGCWPSHLELSDCMGESRDWRKCQTEVRKLQDCMARAAKAKLEKLGEEKVAKVSH